MLHATRHDEQELAEAIRLGARRRPQQAYGNYYEGRSASCALGAAYDGMYHLAQDARLKWGDLERLFDCLENAVRACPEACRKRLPLGPLIVHLNDDHHWSRERIASWVAGGDVPPVQGG